MKMEKTLLNFNPFAVMKKLLKSLMLFAAAAMALTSCENEAMNDGIDTNDTFTLAFTADAPQSRTSVAVSGKTANFSWSVDENGKLTDRIVFLQTQDANKDVNTKYNDVEKSSVDTNGVATFVTEFAKVDDATTYNYCAIYPAQSISGSALTSIGVKLPNVQTLTDGSYDPAADLMRSKLILNVAKDGHGGNLEFTRLAAIGRMTLKGIKANETIESVKLTFEDHVLAGDVTLNFDEVKATYATKGSNSIEVKNGNLKANAENIIYFTCFPGDYTGKYTVEVTTTESTYIKEGNLSGKTLSFTAGDVTGFGATVDFVSDRTIKTFTKITATNLADYSGTYLLVYEAGKVALDGSLTDLDVAGNTQPVTIENDAITASVDIAFTIAKVDDGYSIKSASGYYIGSNSSSSNELYTSQEYSANYLNTIVDLAIKGKGGRSLQYNTSATRFRYYGGTVATALYRMEGTGSDVELVKALESIEVSGAKTAFTVGDEWAFGGTVTAKYNDTTTKDVTATATVNNSAVKLDTAGTYTVTVSYTEDEVTKETTYTVTVSEKPAAGEGGEVVITLAEQGFSNGGEVESVTKGGFTVTFNKGTNSNVPKYYTTGEAVRVYGGNTFTVSGTQTITKIVLTYGSGDGSNGISTTVGSFDTNTNTWTGSEESVTFSIGGSTGHRRIAKITITYAGGGTGGETPETPDTPETPEPVQLGTPSVTATVNGTTVNVSWGAITNASSYDVTVGDVKKNATGTSAEFTDLAAGTYKVSVVAKGDGTNYTDSAAGTTDDVIIEEQQGGGDDSGDDTQYFVKVTSTPSDWSGTYLIVYETSNSEAIVFNGLSGAGKYDTATISNGAIEATEAIKKCAVEIATMTNGYSVKMNGSATNNNDKYLYGTSGSNKMNFGTSAQLNTISYDATNKCVLITSNTSVLRWNDASNNKLFRYYKSASYASQKGIQLYKLAE